MKRIVVVEDEVFMREELENLLQKAGYEVHAVDLFEHVAKNLLEMSPNLILLDINLPNLSGFQICREVKQRSPIPVVILTSRDQMRDELHALDIGADEYLTKPCRKERLLARIANVLKRYEGRANLLEGEGFLLDRQTYTLYIHDASVVLPKNQGKLLEVFLLGGQKVVTKEDLCDALWGTSEFIDENALQVNLTRLKKTMTNLQMHQKIVPVRGAGYRLMMEGGPDEA
ncbi:MAG: response regulator transcription factor [Hespellia sp.]|nr:response regulator transcription factor [Hespellia sp.]